MSYSQFSYLNLHLHGLIYDHSVLPWQDQPSIKKFKKKFEYLFENFYFFLFIIELYDKCICYKNKLVD